MKKHLLTILVYSLFVTGCTWTIHQQKHLQPIFLSSDVTINVNKIWPLTQKGAYFQMVKATYKNESQTFFSSIRATEDVLDIIILNDLQGKIYDIKVTPCNIIWEETQAFTKKLALEFILGDFLLGYLPYEKLQENIKGADVTISIEPHHTIRSVFKNGRIIRKITLKKGQDNTEKVIKIENLEYGYQLDIQTAAIT